MSKLNKSTISLLVTIALFLSVLVLVAPTQIGALDKHISEGGSIGWLQLPSYGAYPDGGPGLPSGSGSAVTIPGTTDPDTNPGTGPVEVASAVALFGTVSTLGAAFVVAKKKYDR